MDRLNFQINAVLKVPSSSLLISLDVANTSGRHCHLANKYGDIVRWWTSAWEALIDRCSPLSHGISWWPTPPQILLFSHQITTSCFDHMIFLAATPTATPTCPDGYTLFHSLMKVDTVAMFGVRRVCRTE